MTTLINDIEELAKKCKKEGVAITIWANGTWEQLGGKRQLYNFGKLETLNKRALMERIRMLEEEKAK